MRRTGILAALAVLLVAGVLFASSHLHRVQAANRAAQDAQVTVDNFSFSPAALTVRAGTQVTWTNRDDVPHTIVNTDGKFKSQALDTDEKFSFTFSKPGTYEYFCSLHPRMTGRVIVK